MTSLMKNVFRPARLPEYLEWLNGYLATGGTVTHAYDYPFDNAGFLMALDDFTTDGETGSRAAKIIVPSGVRWLTGGLGHNRIHFIEDFGYFSNMAVVPVYSDPEFDDVPGAAEVREREQRLDPEPPITSSDVTDYREWQRGRRS